MQIEDLPPEGRQRARERRVLAELRKGDSMILYTDGVVERRAGDQKLATVLPWFRGRNAEEIADALMDWAALTADRRQQDDAALLIVRATP
jgi:serine phosphatase RsbU (regulator of sigma subunit)